jgi:hypothetical protein
LSIFGFTGQKSKQALKNLLIFQSKKQLKHKSVNFG